MRFKGKTVVVTGGSAGIGREVSVRFLTEGARVVVIDIVPPDFEAEFHNADVREEEAISKALTSLQGIDVLVNNAGIYRQSAVENTQGEELDLVVDTNLKGPYIVTKHALPLLKITKGTIINVSSALGIQAEPESPAYCATKAALIMLTKCLALQYPAYGIRVNAVLPGPIDTKMLRDAFPNEKSLQDYTSLNPMRKIGTTRDVANVILFLASDDARYVNGACYPVDGGEAAASAFAR